MAARLFLTFLNSEAAAAAGAAAARAGRAAASAAVRRFVFDLRARLGGVRILVTAGRQVQAARDVGIGVRALADGLHLACLSGVWMCVVNGFLGMRHYKDGIHFEPHIPSEWESYDCNICYHGAVIGIEVGKAEAVFTLKSGDEVEFFLNGEKKRLTASDNKCECPVR